MRLNEWEWNKNGWIKHQNYAINLCSLVTCNTTITSHRGQKPQKLQSVCVGIRLMHLHDNLETNTSYPTKPAVAIESQTKLMQNIERYRYCCTAFCLSGPFRLFLSLLLDPIQLTNEKKKPSIYIHFHVNLSNMAHFMHNVIINFTLAYQLNPRISFLSANCTVCTAPFVQFFSFVCVCVLYYANAIAHSHLCVCL